MSIYDAEIEFPCPGCNHQIKETLGQLHTDKATVCAVCGAKISLGDGGVEGLDELAEAILAARHTSKPFGNC